MTPPNASPRNLFAPAQVNASAPNVPAPNMPHGMAASAPKRFHQFRHFPEQPIAALAKVRQVFTPGKTVEREEDLFILPGRRDHIVKIIDGKTVAMRSRVEVVDGLEVWEETGRDTLPLRRSLSARIGTAIPRFRAALSTFTEAAPLADALGKKSKHFRATTRVQELTSESWGGDVKAFITEQDIDGETTTSVVLRAEDGAVLAEAVNDLRLAEAQNTNIGEFLLTG